MARTTTLSKTNLDEKINSEVTKLLVMLKFNPAYKGFTYIRESIYYIVSNKLQFFNLTRDVYEYIANKHNVTVPQIEKSIRLSISQASINYNFERKVGGLISHFQDLFRFPKNKSFIAAACEIINDIVYNKKYNNFSL